MSDDALPVVHSIIRVNPVGYEPDDVMLRADMGEVTNNTILFMTE